MGVIKASVVPKAALRFSMKDVEDHARTVLSRAAAQAEQLIAAAQEEGESLKQQMKVEGFAAGKKEGIAKGIEEGKKAGHQAGLAEHKVELAEVVKSLSAAMQQVEGSRKQLEADALSEVVRLAVSIARRVTKRQAEVDDRVLIDNLRDAMKLVVHSADLRVAVNPKQKKILSEALPALGTEWPALEHAQLIEDATLGVGGCRVFTLHGRVDGDLEGQLDRVIADVLPGSGATKRRSDGATEGEEG